MKSRFLLLFTLCYFTAWAEPKPGAPTGELPPPTSGNVSMTVAQLAIPAKVRTNRISAVDVKLKFMGSCAGKVTINASFYGKDVVSKKISLNKAETKEVDVKTGLGETYRFQSEEFVYTPEFTKVDAKGKSTTVATSGFLPYGYLVQVESAGKVIATIASSKGMETLAGAK